MTKHTMTAMVIMACLVGCSGHHGTASNAEAPPSESVEPDEGPPPNPNFASMEFEGQEAAEPEESESGFTEFDEDAEQGDSDATTGSAPDSATKAPSPSQLCPGLSQSKCRITIGCQWSTRSDACEVE